MTHSGHPRTAIVTGASSGFGRMTAEALAEGGWHVLAVTRQDNAAIEGCDTVVLDIAEPEAGAELAQRCGGRLDVLINNAGYGQAGPLENLSDAEIGMQFEVNVLAVARLTRDLLPALRATRGAIINLSSVLGYAGMPFQSLYCASKFAVEGLSESLYHELRPHGVRVHVVEPGAFRTRFAANKRLGAAGAYEREYAALEGMFRRRGAETIARGGPRDPVHVMQRMVDLAEGRRSGLRHRVGVDAQATYLLRRLLPQRWADGVLSLIYDRMMR